MGLPSVGGVCWGGTSTAAHLLRIFGRGRRLLIPPGLVLRRREREAGVAWPCPQLLRPGLLVHAAAFGAAAGLFHH
jgi:hypothetical protein